LKLHCRRSIVRANLAENRYPRIQLDLLANTECVPRATLPTWPALRC
jgi:hypothetical protein